MLNQYYAKYIALFVQEFGLNSAYKNSFADETAYITALCLLIEQQKPLLEVDRKGNTI